MKFDQLLEESTGYTGSAAIAANPSADNRIRRRDVRGGDNEWHLNAAAVAADREGRAPLQNASPEAIAKARAAKAKLAKQRSFVGRLKGFLEQRSKAPNFRISESFDMDDIVSRLGGLEKGNRPEEQVVSYGVEDDEGNLMRVSVRAEQAEEFEARLAQELADAMRRKEVTDGNKGFSMAELLYNLNSEFDIVDVQFPTIPVDAVYNADKVSYGVADTASENIGGEGDLGAEGEMGGEPPVDDLAGFPDELPGEEGLDPITGEPAGGDLGGDPNADPLAVDGEEDPMVDDASVGEFPEDEVSAEPSEEGILQSVLAMLKADAEAKTAEANARAEEARAKQAEYTAMATDKAVTQQEEQARMELAMSNQKDQEKQAKKIADLAKFRVSNASSTSQRAFGEGKLSFGDFLTVLTEGDEFDTMQTLNKEKAAIRLKYKPEPNDTPEATAYKSAAMRAAYKEVQAKIERVQASERYKQAMARKEQQNPTPPDVDANPQPSTQRSSGPAQPAQPAQPVQAVA